MDVSNCETCGKVDCECDWLGDKVAIAVVVKKGEFEYEASILCSEKHGPEIKVQNVIYPSDLQLLNRIGNAVKQYIRGTKGKELE